MRYHAHVYWQNEAQRREALLLRQPLVELGCSLGNIWDRDVGPHPLPMYQVSYNSNIAKQVEELLSSTKLNILLHDVTGNDVRDHTVGARWIGDQLTLDIQWLRQYAEGKV